MDAVLEGGVIRGEGDETELGELPGNPLQSPVVYQLLPDHQPPHEGLTEEELAPALVPVHGLPLLLPVPEGAQVQVELAAEDEGSVVCGPVPMVMVGLPQRAFMTAL